MVEHSSKLRDLREKKEKVEEQKIFPSFTVLRTISVANGLNFVYSFDPDTAFYQSETLSSE